VRSKCKVPVKMRWGTWQEDSKAAARGLTWWSRARLVAATKRSSQLPADAAARCATLWTSSSDLAASLAAVSWKDMSISFFPALISYGELLALHGGLMKQEVGYRTDPPAHHTMPVAPASKTASRSGR